jgi:hypothetical protein
MAWLIRFYGLSFKEAGDLDMESVDGLWKAMHVISAQETLIDFSISDYPHLKPKERIKLYRSFEKSSRLKEDAIVSTTTQVQERLRTILNG